MTAAGPICTAASTTAGILVAVIAPLACLGMTAISWWMLARAQRLHEDSIDALASAPTCHCQDSTRPSGGMDIG